MKKINLWKMIIKSDSVEGENPFEFCKKNNFLGCGWRLSDDNGNSVIPKSIEECEEIGRRKYDNAKGFVSSIQALKEMKEDDLIWTRKDGKDGTYYLCRVTGAWDYKNSDDNYKNDIFNVVPVEFIEAGTIEDVPFKAVNSFRTNKSIHKIRGVNSNHAALNATKNIYNKKTGSNYYEIENKNTDILELFLPDDIEEIISLYLQLKKNYLIYTYHKSNQQRYEFGASDGSHFCYSYVKTGNGRLDFNNYNELTQKGHKVYLFALSEKYTKNENKDIEVLSKAEVESFVIKHNYIMPERVRKWL